MPYFQFPHKVITRKAHLDGQRVLRELSTEEETRYDELGNPVWHRNALGGIEASEYYPVSGETDNCSGRSDGPNHPSEKSYRKPASRHRGPGQTDSIPLSIIAGTAGAPAFALPTFVQSSEERLLLVEGENLTELVHSSQTFIVDPTSPHHARLLSETETVQGKSATRAYGYQLNQARDARSLQHAVLQENVTITGHDGHQSSSQSSQDLYSGLMVTEQTDKQMRIAFAHDALGRVVQEVAARIRRSKPRSTGPIRCQRTSAARPESALQGVRKRSGWMVWAGKLVEKNRPTAVRTYTAWTGGI